MLADKNPDLSIDEWMTANSELGHKRLHALGVITQRWNRAERWLFTIFCDVSGYDEAEAWALVYNSSTPAISERIRSLLKIRNYATEAPLIENALEVFNVCRQNRNSVTHAWTRGLSPDGQLALASKSKKADNLDADPFPSSLDDLRRVADEIESLNTRLWLLSCFAEDAQPTESLEKLPMPILLVQPPQQSNAKPQRPPRTSAASRRSAAISRTKK
jgi:hypothetical protein